VISRPRRCEITTRRISPCWEGGPGSELGVGGAVEVK
jgi:hypothetical protein